MEPSPALSHEERHRYERHLIVPGFGEEEQEKLKNARVLVIGAGGLGSAVLHYLAAAGVGCIGIVEFDTVSPSNLQRQILYTTHDLGGPKAEIAAERLMAINPERNHDDENKFPQHGQYPPYRSCAVPTLGLKGSRVKSLIYRL